MLEDSDSMDPVLLRQLGTARSESMVLEKHLDFGFRQSVLDLFGRTVDH